MSIAMEQLVAKLRKLPTGEWGRLIEHRDASQEHVATTQVINLPS